MDMERGRQKLLGEFPKVSLAQWRALVDEGLSGASFEKKLVSHLREGFDVQPLYTRANALGDLDFSGYPGFAPFTRGATVMGRDGLAWKIRQQHAHPDSSVSRAAIAKEIEQGAESIELRFDQATRAGVDPVPGDGRVGEDGLSGGSVALLAAIIEGVDLDGVSVSIHAAGSALGVSALWVAALQAKGISLAQIEGNLNADPLGALTVDGALPTSLEDTFAQMVDLAHWVTRHAPKLRAVNVSAEPYHNAGATASQELACALATGLAYLRVLTESGFSLAQAMAAMSFSFSIGTDLFVEIAKLRAARLCWYKIFSACGGTEDDFSMRLHARTSARTKTVYDPWVNMLRATVEGFVGAVGGADSLATSPFDEALGYPDDFSRRIALNEQVLLREESNLKRVIDPAGGSWYVEWLTDRLAREAWAQFQEIERLGGMQTALESGEISSRLERSASAQRQAVARRKEQITGVSEFANLNEGRIVKSEPDLSAIRGEIVRITREACSARDAKGVASALEALRVGSGKGAAGERTQRAVEAAKAGATLGELSSALGKGEPSRIARLVPMRAAEGFEELRDACEGVLVRTGRRPSVFLANLGPIPAHKARANFAQNFFEAGGIGVISNDGFSRVEDAVEAFERSGALAAVLCGSDESYAQWVPSLAPQLVQAGATRLYLAGRPGEREEQDRAAGIEEFIFLGCDVLQTLREFLSHEGVL